MNGIAPLSFLFGYYLCWSSGVGQSLDNGCKLARLGQDHRTVSSNHTILEENIQETKIPWFHTSATRWRSNGALVQLDHTEEQNEALSLHDSTRSAIGFHGQSGNFKAVTRLGPCSIIISFTNNCSPIFTIAHYLKHLELYALYYFFKNFSSLLLFFKRASIWVLSDDSSSWQNNCTDHT